MTELLNNRVLIAAIVASVVAQIIKVFYELATKRRWDWSRFLETGGMPSAHTAAVTALTVGIGLTQGWGSISFAIAAVFSYIVMYDAANVRRSVGQQAELLNELAMELEHLFKEGYKPDVLEKILGHTYPQVLAGLIVGVMVGWIICR